MFAKDISFQLNYLKNIVIQSLYYISEDIHLGYVCWLNNIPTYVLDKDKNDIDT